jgi:CDP-glucose 4,6-dehydratase
LVKKVFNRILITGCTGLLGLNYTKKILSTTDSKVYGIALEGKDNPLVKELANYSNFSYFNVNIADCDFDSLLDDIQPDLIFHFAAQSQVLDALSDPLFTFETNIKGTWNLLESCKNIVPKSKIIFSSSDKVYGETLDLPYLESNKLQSVYPYDVSKISSDFICQTYKEIFRLDIKIFRSVNIFGPYDLNFNRIIPSVLRDISYGKNPRIRSNGEALREYIYVDQLIENIDYLVYSKNSSLNYIYNFGSGNSFKVIELVNLILESVDSELIPNIQNNSVNEIKDQFIDSSLFNVDYEPSKYKSSFKKDLSKTVEWYFENLKNFS